MSTKEVTVDVKGMFCMSCVKNIEGKASSQPGVLAAKVDLKAAKGTFTIDPTKVTSEDLVTLIKSLGFEAKLV